MLVSSHEPELAVPAVPHSSRSVPTAAWRRAFAWRTHHRTCHVLRNLLQDAPDLQLVRKPQ